MAMNGDHRNSDVGVLPTDWHIVPLGELVASVEYGSSAKSHPSGEVPVLRMGNLQEGKVVWDDLVYTDNQAEIAKYSLKSGDVLFNRTNTIELVGKTSLYSGERRAIFAGYLIRITAAESKLDARYLNYVLNTRASKRYSAKVLSVAVGQANINGQKLKTYPIPLPPTRAEQDAIAEALSDADALIESLEQLLGKKRQIKQGALQELLTGKKRLPGFGGEWKTKRLGEVSCMKSGEGITSDSIDEYSQFPCYGGNGLRGYTTRFTHDGTFALIGRQGALCGNVVLAEGRFFASEHAIVVAPIGQTNVHWLAMVLGRMNLNQYSESSAQPGLSVAKLLRLTTDVPPAEEQRAIATVLSGLNTEIGAIEDKLAKARQIKQGMMQELLTGRIRLV